MILEINEICFEKFLSRKNYKRILSLFFVAEKLDISDIGLITDISTERISAIISDLSGISLIAEGKSTKSFGKGNIQGYYFLNEKNRERTKFFIESYQKSEQYKSDSDLIALLLSQEKLAGILKV